MEKTLNRQNKSTSSQSVRGVLASVGLEALRDLKAVDNAPNGRVLPLAAALSWVVASVQEVRDRRPAEPSLRKAPLSQARLETLTPWAA